MSNNGVKARQAWGRIKAAAQCEGPSLLEGIAKLALQVWAETDAGTKLSADRATREAFVASLVGAAVVDGALDKLAAEGAYSVPEVEFLRDLNAEAALHDLARFQKNAGAGTALLDVLKAHPELIGTGVGAVGGGLAGARFGAYADEENPRRGALRYALPGAAMGGLLGHGLGQLGSEHLSEIKAQAEKAVQAAREAELHRAKIRALRAQAQRGMGPKP